MLLPLFLSLFLMTSTALARQVTVTWEPVPEPTLAGYVLYYGWTSGAYEFAVNVGKQTSYTVDGLAAGETYYFAIAAHDAFGYETPLSEEVTATLPLDPASPLWRLEIGEVAVDNTWTWVAFRSPFVAPIVVATPPSSSDQDPTVVRIQEVSKTGFWIRLQEWDYLDGIHATEQVGYMVLERGSYVLPGGVRVEAGQLTTDKISAFITVLFAEPFQEVPIVITSVTSVNEAEAVSGRIKEVNTQGFMYRLQEQEKNVPLHAVETVSYIAWEPSQGTMNGLTFEAGATPRTVRHQFYPLLFASSFTDTPVMLAEMQTTYGVDTAALRWQNKDSFGVEVKVEEEQSADNETFHTTEVVGYLLVAPADTVAQPPVPRSLPHGVFSLTPGGKPIEETILAHPWVTGVSLRGRWQEVESAEGVYDWSYFDREIARADQAGKQVLLRITSGGRNTPQWVFDAGVQTFSFIDSNPYHETYNQSMSMPIFWDPIFLQKKLRLITAMGERFASHSALTVVGVSCANATTDDWNVPDRKEDVSTWRAIGYTSERLIDACNRLIDATINAFPNQLITLAVGVNLGNLDPDPQYVAREVVAYARATYPGKLVVQKNSLSTTTPDPLLTSTLGTWQIVFDQQPMVAGQMLWFVTNDRTCRMNGKVPPCDPITTLQQAATIGTHYGMRYQEIYSKDILNPDLTDVVREAAGWLTPPSVPAHVRAW
jgi:hypothetical protein